MGKKFSEFAELTARLSGAPMAFLLSCASIAIWALLGPLFGFSDTWQLVINTATTIITFLMVFLIQNTQNRDAAAIHAKLDELILITKGAHNDLIEAEKLSEEDIARLRQHISELKDEAGETGTPESGADGSLVDSAPGARPEMSTARPG